MPYLAVKRKTFFIGKKSNFNFQKWGYFGSNSEWVIDGFFEIWEVLGSNSEWVIGVKKRESRPRVKPSPPKTPRSPSRDLPTYLPDYLSPEQKIFSDFA